MRLSLCRKIMRDHEGSIYHHASSYEENLKVANCNLHILYTSIPSHLPLVQLERLVVDEVNRILRLPIPLSVSALSE